MSIARDRTVDVLRGVAILMMVAGHLAAAIYLPSTYSNELFRSPFPLTVLVVGGFAPALFITISGMMVAHSTWRKGRGLGAFLKRGALVLLAGVLIDVLVWHIRPFTTVDVLYLIGVSLPVAYLFATRVPRALRWVAVLAFIVLTPLLQSWLGYTDYPTEYTLDGRIPNEIANQTNILNHWLCDGWFPLFPWLGFSILGVALADRRWGEGGRPRFGAREGLLPGLVLIALAIGLGWPDPQTQSFERIRYGGAFMPPDLGYLISSVGGVLLLFWLVDRKPDLALYRPVEILGAAALFVYVGHSPAIEAIQWALGGRVPALLVLPILAGLVLALIVGAQLLALVLRLARRRR
jgi:uncharacterized membrane protein